VGAVEVTFVPSQHCSRRLLGDANRTLWGGFVVKGARATIYHSGDTGYFAGFAEIGRRFEVDAALLPIGAYDPAWFMSPQHLSPEEALLAFRDLGARTFFAMHSGRSSLRRAARRAPRQLEADDRLDRPRARARHRRERGGGAAVSWRSVPPPSISTSAAVRIRSLHERDHARNRRPARLHP
jgi:L-ascorbate metabolism protein UlaG (beta-lactamase superfamily)